MIINWKYVIYSYFILLIVLVCISCGSFRQLEENVFGEYCSDSFYDVKYTLILNENNKFTYHWVTGFLNGTTYGTWKLKGKKLILNSYRQTPLEKKYNIRERNVIDTKHLEILIIDHEEQEGVIGAYCTYMLDSTVLYDTSTDLEGNCILPPNDKATSLHISSLGYDNVTIPMQDFTSNSIIIELIENDHYKYFRNTKWYYKKGRIYNPQSYKISRFRKTYFNKIKPN